MALFKHPRRKQRHESWPTKVYPANTPYAVPFHALSEFPRVFRCLNSGLIPSIWQANSWFLNGKMGTNQKSILKVGREVLQQASGFLSNKNSCVTPRSWEWSDKTDSKHLDRFSCSANSHEDNFRVVQQAMIHKVFVSKYHPNTWPYLAKYLLYQYLDEMDQKWLHTT